MRPRAGEKPRILQKGEGVTDELTYESTKKAATVDGVEFLYHEAGSGRPLIMLHGSGPGVSAWSNFRHNLPVFAEHFRVIMPDLPGFGASSLPEFKEVYSLDAARRIAGLMDHLGIESALFIGNSMGGAVAAEMAANLPGRVERMAIMGSGGLSRSLFQTEPSEGFQKLFAFLQDPTRERMTEWVRTMLFDQALVTDELIDERMANATADGVLARNAAVFGALLNPAFQAAYTPLWTRPDSVTTPTLMLWGREDRMLPYDQAHFANRWMPNVELHTFSHCGHWIQIERKKEFERIAIEFLTRGTD
ncbi:alpha/beta fold hydrolase [Gordonia amarae]|uniref:Alpha/beta fold hydrolase n=1 Tax=Gordonia amarae TaxID=36821 RepID=A0A857KQU2_9ACTN|nr:alpha/beta fold hydrolase [Gordonia amarae]QHN23265.1 alpha/beta fold hydrolase [Gordonia amarae]QHN33429.1 alpha/beta fold hydrolase [Gordonia amarae]QHN40913.1 alpha/beta fold hydrolase [Gordonia amarae]